VRIENTPFGSFDVPDEKLIDFPAGLPGFEECRRFTLMHEEGSATVLLLQSIDDPAVCFSVADPKLLGMNYEFSLYDDEVRLLQLETTADAMLAVILRRDELGSGTPASAGMRANFMAPLVINAVNRRGLQKILGHVGCEITLRALG
jgi:flagellar assembly factor FliW